MCGCRSPCRRACPPPPHIKKAFDSKWYKVTRRAPKGHGTWVSESPFTPTLSPLEKGGEGVGSGGVVRGTF